MSRKSEVDAALARLDDSGVSAPPEPRGADLGKPVALEDIHFESIEEFASATNDHHVQILLNELPWMRMGVAILNMNDREMEARARAQGPEYVETMLEVAETLNNIRERYGCAVSICADAARRILVILSRVTKDEDKAP